MGANIPIAMTQEDVDKFLTNVKLTFDFATALTIDNLRNIYHGEGIDAVSQKIDQYENVCNRILESINSSYHDIIEQKICALILISMIMINLDGPFRSFAKQCGFEIRVPPLMQLTGKTYSAAPGLIM